MIAFVYYLLKVSAGSGVLYAYYWLALKNRRFHQWNRFYLLAAVALSLLLPLLEFKVERPAAPNVAVTVIDGMQSADAFVYAYRTNTGLRLSTEQVLAICYVLVSLALLFSLFAALRKIRRLMRQQPAMQWQDVQLVNTREREAPFSFWRTIFWNENVPLHSPTGQQIFQHELVHVRERHTFDKLFLQTVLAACWCNPFFWLIRRELSHIHEFIADRKAVGEQGASALAAMLLQSRFPQQYASLVNPFFQTSIKRRLSMLTQTKNPRLAYAGRVAALPVLAFVTLAFTLRSRPSLPHSSEPGLIGFAVVDALPKAKNIDSVNLHPADGEIEVFYKDGSVERLTEAEAKRRNIIAAKKSDNSMTVREYRIPKNEAPLNGDSVIRPLVIVDGAEIPYALLSKLDAKKLQTVSVTKGPTAIASYGEKGRNGAIEIRTKKSADDEVIDSTIKALPETFNFQGEVSVARLNEPVFTQSEKPASIDTKIWRGFLEKNLAPLVDVMAKQKAPAGLYKVNVRFVVEKDGTLSEIKLLDRIGYGADEVLRSIMKSSPRWQPAEQNGRIVRSYFTQPILIQITNKNSVPQKQGPPTISVEDVKKRSLHQLTEVPDTDEIVVCDFAIDLDNGDILAVTNQGNSLTGTAQALLNISSKGKLLTIDRILVKRSGKLVKMPAKVYQL